MFLLDAGSMLHYITHLIATSDRGINKQALGQEAKTKVFLSLFKIKKGMKGMKYPFPVPSPNPNFKTTFDHEQLRITMHTVPPNVCRAMHERTTLRMRSTM